MAAPEELEQVILQFVSRPDYRPLKPRMIAQRLHLPKAQADEVKRVVKQLVRRGQLAYGDKHLVRAAGVKGTVPFSLTRKLGQSPILSSGRRTRTGTRRVARKSAPAPSGAAGPNKDRLVGVFHRTSKGFGFVRPESSARDPANDIYIPQQWTGDAATGDAVVVQLHRGRPGQRGPRGQIVEVLDRQTHQFVGTYFESAGSAYVQVDGTVFSQPIYVGDPGAKGARADDKVVFEMVRFPSAVHDGEGAITEVLGPHGQPGVDTLSIIRQYDLPDHFAADALEEARLEAEKFDPSIVPGRLDLTGLTVVTIDPVDARDFDDAISLELKPGGNWRLGVHIADVSHFVRPRTALDREARDRGTSVYLPDRVLPMLPEIISNSLASLQPDKVRYTKSVFIEFTPAGLPLASEYHSAAIRSSKRLTYEQVDAFLADPQAWRRKLGAKVHALLGQMHTLAMILRQRRLKQGALELNMPEVKVDLDAAGRVTGAHVTENTESHQIIEEFMLAANCAVALALSGKQLPFLRRIHQSPSPLKIKALNDFVTELGIRVSNLQSRFELQKLLREVTGSPQQHAVHFAVLRSLQRAFYGPQEEGHYALAADCYCHFTSPIRRYPDLTVHRLLDDLLAGRKPKSQLGELLGLGQHCSDREQRAEAAERDLTKLKLLAYLSQRIGEEMDAVVTGVESFGLFVQGVELPAEGLIHADALTDDFYSFDRTTHSLTGRRSGKTYRLGDLLRVAVARVDPQRRELDFRLVQRKKTKKGPEGVKAERPAERAKRAPPRRKRR
jgi:ribonuclease R